MNARAQIEESRKALQDLHLVRDPFLDEALKQDPALYTQSAEKVKWTLDEWRAGRIPSLTEALKEQLDIGALPAPDFTSLQLACPHLESDAAASTSFGQYIGQPPRAGQSLATVTELGLPLHQDPSDDMLDQDSSPPLGIMPVIHRGMIRAVMRPTMARVLSRPGRGPLPLPISVHPQARPFGVAKSSLALREAAQLRAKDPTARQLVSRRHAPPRLEPPPRPEPCLPEGFEMPEKLPSPETAVTLLAQANRAHQRYLNLPKQSWNASQFASPAVLGADAATAGTAGDFIKDHPLINPRAKANPAAAPQAIAATAASAAAPIVAAGLPSMGAQKLTVEQHLATHATQPASPSAQALAQAAPLATVAPTATLPAGSAIAPAAAAEPPSPMDQVPAASTAEEAVLATTDNIDDESGPQNGKAIRQRPGQKQRKRLKEIAELKKVEDDAKAVAEADAFKKAEAEAKAKQEAQAKAEANKQKVKAAEAAAMAEAKKAKEARAKEEDASLQKAQAASEKAAAELLASEEAAEQGKESKIFCRCCIHSTTTKHDQWSLSECVTLVMQQYVCLSSRAASMPNDMRHM